MKEWLIMLKYIIGFVACFFICGEIFLYIWSISPRLIYAYPIMFLLANVALIVAAFRVRLPFRESIKFAALIYAIFAIPLGILGVFMYRPADYPFEYEGAKWVLEQPPAYFEVIDGHCVGEITIDGETTEFYLYCHPYDKDYFFFPLSTHYEGKSYYDDHEEEALFVGDAKYGKEKITVKITDNSKGILPKNVRKIKFIQERAGEKR